MNDVGEKNLLGWLVVFGVLFLVVGEASAQVACDNECRHKSFRYDQSTGYCYAYASSTCRFCYTVSSRCTMTSFVQGTYCCPGLDTNRYKGLTGCAAACSAVTGVHEYVATGTPSGDWEDSVYKVFDCYTNPCTQEEV